MEKNKLKIANHILLIENLEEKKFLRKKTHELDPALLLEKDFQKEMRSVLTTMRLLMHEANGVGLSANQAGIPYRFFIARAPEKNGRWKQYAFFNPVIKKFSKEKEVSEEGCLSVPGKFGPVERSFSLTLEAYNLQGKKIKLIARGLLARICQHEINHLDGILFIDKAKYIEDIAKSSASPQI